MPVDPTRAKEILSAAVQISNPAERAAYLDRECDEELRKWVDALLWAHGRPASPPTEAAPPTAEFPSLPDTAPTGMYDPNETGPLEPTQSATDLPPEAPPAGSSSVVTATFHPSAPGAATGAHEAADTGDGSHATPAPGGSLERGSSAASTSLWISSAKAAWGRCLARQSRPVKRDGPQPIKRGRLTHRSRPVRGDEQALRLTDHPNIARVYDGGTTPEGGGRFVMELVRGVPITKFCDDNRLSPKNRLELFVEVPSRPACSPERDHPPRPEAGEHPRHEVDGRPTPKVIDFGVAKAVDGG